MKKSPPAGRGLQGARQGAFYGWWMVLWCTVVRGVTVPGQTIGVSAFIDDFIEALDTSRSAVSSVYLVGTLTGAVALPFIGRWVDRVGVRHAMTVLGALFAMVVALTGTVQNLPMLAIAFVGLRTLGQGALSLTGSTGIALWFENRRGLALAISTTGTLALLSFAPLGFGALIDAIGWRWAWLVLGCAVAAIVIPVARLAIADRPEELGQVPDGVKLEAGQVALRQRSYTVAEAVRTPAFWTLGVLVALMAAFITGLTFHNEDVLGAQGLTEDQAAAIFVPQMVGSVSVGFLVGWLTDRVAARPLMFFGGMMIALGVFLATVVSPGMSAVAYGVVTGIAVGTMSSLGGALYPKWFGVDNVASIRGVSGTIGSGASALGPLLLSVGNDISGSYEPVLLVCVAITLVVTVLAVLVPTPKPELVEVR